MARASGYRWLVLPAAILLVLFFAYPVFWFLLRSLSHPDWGLQNFRELIERPIYARVLWNTAVISFSTTAICLILGYPMAYTLAHAGERARRLLLFVVLIPFWSSLLVRTFAWMVLLQQKGIVNKGLVAAGIIEQPLAMMYNRIGLLVGMVHILLPFMILPIYSVMVRIDPVYETAAAGLGAPPAQSFFRVYLPLSLPGVLTGSVLVFVVGLGYYITPALLGGPADIMIAQIIERQVAEFGRWGVGAALGVVLLAASSVTFVLVHRSMNMKPA